MPRYINELYVLQASLTKQLRDLQQRRFTRDFTGRNLRANIAIKKRSRNVAQEGSQFDRLERKLFTYTNSLQKNERCLESLDLQIARLTAELREVRDRIAEEKKLEKPSEKNTRVSLNGWHDSDWEKLGWVYPSFD